MYVRYLGFVLLVWFPGVLRAQSAAQSCRAPSLNDGYFVPEQVAYSHETKLTYACDNGRKPAVEGWWATSTCQNGKWSHEPQCIDEKACIPPTIPNAKYIENQNGWYEEGHIIRITCDKGYKHKGWDATAECTNGTWSSVPVCEKSALACSEPPKIPHAVIIHQEYQELFAADSEVQYECEDGYTVEGADTRKSIFCIAGNWTAGPTCSRETGSGTGHGGSAVGGTGGGHTTSAGSGTQPAGGGRGTRPGTGHGGSTVGGTAAGSGTQPAGGGRRPGTGHVGSAGGGHTTSAGSGTRPVGGGSSTSSELNERETEPQITTFRNCGKPPTVLNGDVVGNNEMFLKYQCGIFYKRVGPETVVCYSDGTWSEVPTCKAAYCSVDTAEYTLLKPVGVKIIKDGESVRLECVRLDHWWVDHYSVGRCTNARMRFTRCCTWVQLKTNYC